MKLFLTLVFTSLVFTSFGQQTNCLALKTENDNLKYLLGLYSNHKKDTADKIEFSFFKATGNINKQTVVVEVIVKNINPIHQKIEISKFDIIDESTNSHDDSGAQFGTEHYYSFIDILSQTPKKFVAKITGVVPSTMQFVKNVTIKFRNYEEGATNYFNVVISGDKINWK